MQGGRLTAQIALEFLVVYSFVLLIFAIFFALIVSQRAVSLIQQQYALLQLQAQNVAGVINEAVDAGNGFSATVSLQSAVSSPVPYNLSVSSTGVVIAKEKIGSQVLSAYAFSSARVLSINGTQLSNGNGYLLPTSSGTLKVSNSQGTVYIDGAPATTLPLAYTMTLNQLQHVKVASFNGVSSIVNVGKGSSLSMNTPLTISCWIETPSVPSGGTDLYILSDHNSGGSYSQYTTQISDTVTGSVSFSWGVSGAYRNWETPSVLSARQWYNIVITRSGTGTSSDVVAIYVNGVSQALTPTGSATAAPQFSLVGNTIIGRAGDYNGQYWNGAIANVQFYSYALTSNQITQLYQSGIGGAPIYSANVMGWWPLDGNTNDYSGNGNTGAPTNVVYNSIVYMQAHVALASGANAANALIGGVTSNGVFTQNSMPNLAAYANSTGYAKAYIIAPNVSRLNLTLFGFNGNSVLAGNLVGWWPLEEGYGSTAYDLSTHANNGVFTNPSWVPLAANRTNIAVASFNGVNSYVPLPYSSALNPTAAIAISAWVYPTSSGTAYTTVIGKIGPTDLAYKIDESLSGTKFRGYIVDSTGGSCVASASSTFSTNTWYLLTYTYSASAGTGAFYVNGVLQGTCVDSNLIETSSNPEYIGSTNGATQLFSGLISNVQLYRTAITASQVSQLYTEGIAGSPIVNAGLAGWWPLAYTANDYSGNGNNGIPANVAYNNVGYSAPNNAIKVASLNGANNYISLSNQNGIPYGSSPRTVVAWVSTTAYPGSNDEMAVAYGTQTSSGDAFTLAIDPNGYLNSDIHAGRATSSLVVPLNSWHMICIVYSSGSQATFYLDSQTPQTVSFSSSSPNTLSGPFYIGQWVSGSGLNFAGSIADVQVYSTALTAQQVQQLYLEGLPLYNKLNVSIG